MPKRRSDSLTWLMWVFLAIFILCIIPILSAGHYAHPLYDDYRYSHRVHEVLMQNGGFADLIRAAVKQVQWTYRNWQGTFSAVFLFAFQPGVFSQDLYFLTTWIMVLGLFLSTLFFCWTAIVTWLHARKEYAVLLAVLISICTIQFVPDKQGAFFWFNGSCYYTLFYSFALIYFSALIRFVITKKISGIVGWLILLLPMTVLMAGANYTTGLFCCEMMAVATVFLLIRKHPRSWVVLLLTVALIYLFTISTSAPGNSIRAAKTTSTGPIEACILSLYFSCIKMGQWTSIPQVVFLVAVTPMLYRLANLCPWRFRFPLLVFFGTFCLYASQLTPPIFAMSNIGAGRQVNIYYYSYYIFWVFNIFYACGWFLGKYPTLINDFQLADLSGHFRMQTVLALMIVFVLGSFSYGFWNMTTFKALSAVESGMAEQYDKEYDAIVDVLESEADVVEIPEVSTTNDFLKKLNLSQNPKASVNSGLAEYYGKSEVHLLLPPEEEPES